MAAAELGDLIAQLGAAVAAGDVRRDDAIARLMATGELSAYGAEAQLRAWRGAPSRYLAAAEALQVRLVGPADARDLRRRGELHFSFPAAADTP